MAANPTAGNQKQQIDRVSETAHEYVDRAASTAASAAERLGEKADEWMTMKDDWVEGAREYVREHPVAALGIAAAAGYLLSILMRSK
jgi:ElaB/YqjD/DUF883 family membrane-anchored ribosome-binding protein